MVLGHPVRTDALRSAFAFFAGCVECRLLASPYGRVKHGWNVMDHRTREFSKTLDSLKRRFPDLEQNTFFSKKTFF